jgi:hypothetical protein
VLKAIVSVKSKQRQGLAAQPRVARRAPGIDTMTFPSTEDRALKVLGTILRIFSYFYEFLLSLVLLAIGGLTLSSGLHNLKLTMLPWTGSTLTYWVFWLGVAGLLITLLAVTRLFRYLFPLWCLFVVVMMFRGFFLSGTFVFSGSDQFRTVIWLVIGAIVAFLASLLEFKPRTARYQG